MEDVPMVEVEATVEPIIREVLTTEVDVLNAESKMTKEMYEKLPGKEKVISRVGRSR